MGSIVSWPVGCRRVGGFVLVCALLASTFPGSAAAQVSPPAASRELSSRDVTVGATVAVDVAVGFSGSVASYAARSSDEGVVSVSVSGSMVSLRGVAAGDAHVTIQATNSAGSAWQRDAAPDRPAEPPPGPFSAIAVGQWHTCALRPDGAATCWLSY